MVVIMPQLGETVAEGTVTKWYKNVGDTVKADDVLFDVETDKVSTEVPAQANGVLGDGIFCIGGTIVRLGTKANVGGASQFPDVGQIPIATRVSAVAGQTSYFTIWYRNAATFCTPATFNDSNGWRMTWTP